MKINDEDPHEMFVIVMNASEDNMFDTVFSNRVVISRKGEKAIEKKYM